MKDFNDLYFEVRLGSDGVLRKTNSGKSVLNLGGANHATSDKDREPLWIAFRAWEKLAEVVAPQCTKGRKLMIRGHIPVLPAPATKQGKVVRNGAEVYLSKESKAVVNTIIDLLRAGDDRVSDNAKVISLLTNQHSTQVVVDIDKMRYMDEKGFDTTTAAPGAEIDLETPTPDDDIPF
ncbi:MAG: single-stranded DNA-binding protein [Anaerolineales bacterium]|nr:single-stranded DNA-binding protein [Anaerolineales bacterium]